MQHSFKMVKGLNRLLPSDVQMANQMTDAHNHQTLLLLMVLSHFSCVQLCVTP